MEEPGRDRVDLGNHACESDQRHGSHGSRTAVGSDLSHPVVRPTFTYMSGTDFEVTPAAGGEDEVRFVCIGS